MKQALIYQPRSGTRVFVCHQTEWMVVRETTNGSMSVVHDGIELTWSAASRTWRHTARALLTDFIKTNGGLAWDDRGEIHAILSREAAWPVAELLATYTTHEQRRLVEATLVINGRGSFALRSHVVGEIGGLETLSSWLEFQPIATRPSRPLHVERRNNDPVVADDNGESCALPHHTSAEIFWKEDDKLSDAA